MRVTVRLDPARLAQLDAEAVQAGLSRSAMLRRHLDEPERPADERAATWEEAVQLLARFAREGSVMAASALERALRVETPPAAAAPEPASRIDELAAKRAGGR